MLFDDFQNHKEQSIRKSLLWEYDIAKIDWMAMRHVVIQRVVERGRFEDFYAALNLYGQELFIQTIKEIKYFNKKDANFVRVIFGIKKKEMLCYTHRPSIKKHWNS